MLLTARPQMTLYTSPNEYINTDNLKTSNYSDSHVDDDQDLLRKTAIEEGFLDANGMLEHYITNGMCPAICVQCGEKHDEELESDYDGGDCTNCGSPSLTSILVIAGVM